jgi:putative transposase
VLIQNGITISMDGRGRALDKLFVERLWRTVKYEDVYLKGYETLPTLLLGLTDYFLFYNGERRHQTPNAVYLTTTGGGAKIVDRFSSGREVTLPAGELGQHQLAAVGQGSILN